MEQGEESGGGDEKSRFHYRVEEEENGSKELRIRMRMLCERDMKGLTVRLLNIPSYKLRGYS